MDIFRGVFIIASVVLLAALQTARCQPYTWTTIAGSPQQIGFADGTNSDTRFGHFLAIAADKNGDVFVGDTQNQVVRKVTHIGADWVVTTIAGKAGVFAHVDGFGEDARFCGIGGITVDRAGRLYVAESCNYTIRKLTPVGTNWLVTTLGGLPGVSGTQDGTGSSARFYPWNVTVDDAGVLYVADEWNYTVRRGEIAMYLRTTRAANQLILSWPNSATNYVLETTSDLTSPWISLTNGVGTFADDFVMTNSTGAGSAFFRLRKL